jgi:hypothetical protein
MNGLDLPKRSAQFRQGFGHLLPIAASGELGFLEQADTTSQVVDHLLASSMELHLAPALFFERHAFLLELLLDPFELGEFLLSLADLRAEFVTGRRTIGPGS